MPRLPDAAPANQSLRQHRSRLPAGLSPGRGGLIYAAAAVAICALAVREYTSDRFDYVAHLQIARSLPFPVPLDGRGVVLLTRGDLRSQSESISVGAPEGRRLALTRVTFARGRSLRRGERLLVPLEGPSRGTRFDLGRWDSDALFELRQLPRSIRVVVHRLATPASVAAVGNAPEAAPKGFQRDLAVATWSGRRPDLFVIDRRPPGYRLRIAIFSGESGFRARISRATLPGFAFPPGRWTVDVARVSLARPDIVLMTRRGPTGSHRNEVHVLSGESGFRNFVMHQPTALPERLPKRFALVLGKYRQTPALQGVDLVRRARLRILPLTSPVPR
jgi:hypothetical protein